MTIRRKFRQRLWTLYNLKKQGFTQEELVRVYKTSIQPVVNYLDVVYHSLLTDEMDEELDRLQNWALQIIFGTKIGVGDSELWRGCRHSDKDESSTVTNLLPNALSHLDLRTGSHFRGPVGVHVGVALSPKLI